ncbi:hypothetical protein GRI89_03435 [Altererythrobacter salegens]|uniref:Uncharacterized protein n=1 Tax=Croceibacterium salegens TaxID=1737568 RepID=A0A6I4SRR9_9SPHN|nr:hypothetical protein [Croceibacterium salegens]MXO58594.1 hypothetical protein [Croceibacterium salegens]
MGNVADLLSALGCRYEQDFSEEAGWQNPPRQEDFESLMLNEPVAKWTSNFDELGAQLACGYHAGNYAFWFCDWIVNVAEGFIIDLRIAHDGFAHPELFQEVYQAFDDGEWDHGGKSNDPIVDYTNPAIAKIVNRLYLKPAR